MSKSLGNTIALSEDDESIRKKLATAATDPARVRRKDPGTRMSATSTPAYIFLGRRTHSVGTLRVLDGGDWLY